MFIRKNIYFLIFAQNIDCGYKLARVVLTSTLNLCFEAKIRKYPYITQFFFLYKRGVRFKGVFISRTCFPDESESCTLLCTRGEYYSFG